MKSALYSLLTSNDYGKALKRIQMAYSQIKSSTVGSTSKTSEEKRQNADILAILILKMMLSSNLTYQFVEFFRLHFQHF